MNPLLIKSYTAEGAIPASRIVTMGTAETQTTLATSAADTALGVSQSQADAADGSVIDVTMVGIVDVEAGAAIAAGAWVTADANGKAVATTTAGDEVVGKALTSSAADGDIINLLIEGGVQIDEVHQGRASLEETFLTLMEGEK